MAARIKDIAEQADVSIATVSLVLNNKPGVGDDTRRRILKIAQEMNYGAAPRGPTGIDRGTIRFLKVARHGHTVNRDHNVFISDYIDGIVQTAKELQYKTEIASFRTTPIAEVVDSVNGQVDLAGAIVLGTELSRADVLAFQKIDVPLVFIDTFLDYISFDFVDMNNEDSVFKIVQHFLSHGHRDIGIVRSSVKTRNFWLRDKAFGDAMRFLGLEPFRAFDFEADSTFDGAYQDMKDYLAARRPLPTALFCTNDIIAFGVIKALREASVRVPEDVSVIGFDDLPTSALVDPPLTSIAVSKREIGSHALSRLHARIQTPEMPSTKIVVGGTLMERASVATVGSPIQIDLRTID
jgi:LacI family transcriptional regulator